MDVSISRSRGPLPIALGASIFLNFILAGAVLWPDAEPADAVPEAVADAAVAEEGAQPAAEEPVAEEAVEPEAAVEVAAKAEAGEPTGVQVTVAELKNSIPQTMAVAADPYGDFVAATLSRVLVWDLDVRKDLRPKDKIEVAWSLGTTDTVVVEAARYNSQKLGRVINAYRFQASGDKFPSYWSADGVEVPHRLRNSPLAEYEQITSLLKDRPTHHGMDFKVATGTPVMATFDGVVTRVNWNWKANGNCIELKLADGVLVKYLHLSETGVKPGKHVRAGEAIGLTGNTGHSTGPHLHYQLNKGKKVIDPVKYHGTDRRKLAEADRAAFADVVAKSNARFESSGALAAK